MFEDVDIGVCDFEWGCGEIVWEIMGSRWGYVDDLMGSIGLYVVDGEYVVVEGGEVWEYVVDEV